MGNKQTIIYSVEMPGQEQPANSTKIRRHPDFVKGLWASPSPQIHTMGQIFQKTFADFSNNNCFGTIVEQAPNSPENGKPRLSIEYLTYRDVELKVHALANAMVELNLAPIADPTQGLHLVGLYSKNRAQWMMVDMACAIYGFTTVPLYDTLGPENISYVLNHSNVQSVFCSGDSCKTIASTSDIGRLKVIITFDPLSDEVSNLFEERGLKWFDFTDLLEMGGSRPHNIPKTLPENIVTFSYTSGTTGPPKAVMISQANFVSCCAILKTKPDVRFYPTDVYLSYLPLPHVLERTYMYGMLSAGGQICFYSGDVIRLKDDIELVKPTVFASVPRIYNRFYDAIKGKLDQSTGLQKILVDKAMETKLNNVTTDGNCTHSLYDALVFSKTKEAMGGHLRLMTSGSAPILPHIHNFIRVVMACPLIEGFGQTETTGVTFATDARDPTTGHVGGPTSNVEFKLEDIPEMNYTHKDVDAQGRLCPRGQICIRGPCIFLGYYKDADKTKEAIDKDGWFHSGDVGCLLPTTGALKIIDRKKNIFKLQHGEYVAAEKVESVYLKRKEISQMYLHGESTEAFTVAIIVPERRAVEELANKLGIKGAFEELCHNEQVRKGLLTILNDFGKKQGLQSFEQAKNIYLEPQPFQLKGVLTSTMKLQRFEAKRVYKQQIAKMYKEGMIVGKDK